jgi:hypothetical protein
MSRMLMSGVVVHEPESRTIYIEGFVPGQRSFGIGGNGVPIRAVERAHQCTISTGFPSLRQELPMPTFPNLRICLPVGRS